MSVLGHPPLPPHPLGYRTIHPLGVLRHYFRLYIKGHETSRLM